MPLVLRGYLCSCVCAPAAPPPLWKLPQLCHGSHTWQSHMTLPHGRNPNPNPNPNPVTWSQTGDLAHVFPAAGQLELTATRDLAPQEEICIDYPGA